MDTDLQRALGNAFAVERELGGGGMSRVFLARDVALDRQVVVKVLSAEASAGVSAERFRRETQLIAKLQHPNIVPLLSAGDADGTLYYVMPYVAGDTLRARMSREGALPVVDAVRILREVLDALAFAHQHGIVHRDIKPENILLAAGHAVLADFGVAKALRDSVGLTSTGISIGTPAYMAPEQAAGDPATNHRADLYAAAVVAYEMLTGRPLFSGSVQQVVTAHMSENPAPVTQRRPEVPPALASLIMQALEKDPARRPQSAAEMLTLVDSLTTPGRPEARPVARRVTRLAPALGVALSLAVVAGFVLWRYSRPRVIERAQSIAVVPFAVTESDTSLVRLSQNLATLVGNSLDGVGEIRAADPASVISHTRAKGGLLTTADAVAVAKALSARSVVYGTIVRTGEMVRINAMMFDAAAPPSQAPVARVDVLAHADSVVAIADSLTIGLLKRVWARGEPPTPHVASITSHSPAALREFLNGEWLFSHGQFHDAGDAFKRAVHADTTFWFAAYRYRSARSWSAEPVEDTAITNRLNRHRANLPERERALLAVNDSSPTQSEFRRRLIALTQQYPDYVPAWQALADFTVHHGQRSGHSVRDAVNMWREVQRLMPTDFPTAEHLALACVALGDVECARAAVARMDTLARNEPSPGLAVRMMRTGLALTVAQMTPQRLDSIYKAGTRDSSLTVFTRTTLVNGAPALVWQPGYFEYMDSATRVVFALAPKTVIGPSEVAGWLMTRAARGDWGALDSAIAMRIPETNNVNRTSPIDLVRARVVAELEGSMVPSRSTVDRLAERAADPSRGPATRAEARWLIAGNALARGDSAEVRTQLAALASDTNEHARIAVRSIRALGMGLGGSRRVAAESLLALEREHGERNAKVWGAFAIDRLFASQWLTESKRYAPADSLLEFTRGYIIWTTASAALPMFAAAQLQRSRIAEAIGDKAEAIRYATIFVRAYDLSPEKHREPIEEAQQRIARLGGKVDAPRNVTP